MKFFIGISTIVILIFFKFEYCELWDIDMYRTLKIEIKIFEKEKEKIKLSLLLQKFS